MWPGDFERVVCAGIPATAGGQYCYATLDPYMHQLEVATAFLLLIVVLVLYCWVMDVPLVERGADNGDIAVSAHAHGVEPVV